MDGLSNEVEWSRAGDHMIFSRSPPAVQWGLEKKGEKVGSREINQWRRGRGDPASYNTCHNIQIHVLCMYCTCIIIICKIELFIILLYKVKSGFFFYSTDIIFRVSLGLLIKVNRQNWNTLYFFAMFDAPLLVMKYKNKYKKYSAVRLFQLLLEIFPLTEVNTHSNNLEIPGSTLKVSSPCCSYMYCNLQMKMTSSADALT